jgi:hypothetical protein
MSGPDASDDAAGVGPFSFVQVGYVMCGTRTTCSLALSKPVVGGDAMIVVVAVYLTPTVTLGDTLGNMYSFVLGPVDDPSYRSYIAAAYGAPAGANTVTATASKATDIYIWASEYRGVTGFDTKVWATGSGTAVSTPNLMTSRANELLFGYVGYFVGGTTDPSFTFRSTGGLAIIEDRLASEAGNYKLTGTQYGAGTWTMDLAAFTGP